MSTITTLIFDLDNTLYPASAGVWELVRQRIDLFMTQKLHYPLADVQNAREQLYRDYGTTLRGLQNTHQFDPIDYLNFVHAVPLHKYIQPDPVLKKKLKDLPYRKVIFTNADHWHTQRVLDQLDISQEIDEIVDILDVQPYCKPEEMAFQKAFDKLNIPDPRQCIMFEDSQKNLITAQKLGMKTVFINENLIHPSQWQQLSQINQLEQVIEYFVLEEGLQ